MNVAEFKRHAQLICVEFSGETEYGGSEDQITLRRMHSENQKDHLKDQR